MLRPILLRWPPIRLLLLLIDQVAGKEDLFRGDAGRPAHQTQWAGWGPSWLICLSYGFGLYQSLERSFVALVKLDWRPGRSSSDDAPCPEECPVGLKFTSLSNKTTYEPCPKGQEIAFQQCPASFKTTLSGSVTAEEWTEPNGVFSFQGKHLCPLSGRDLPARSPEEQLPGLPARFHHQNGRRHSLDDCSNPCSPACNQTICSTKGVCLFVAATNVQLCECKAFAAVPPDSPIDFVCMDRCDNLCKNDGNALPCTANAPAATPASNVRPSPTLPTLSAELLVSFIILIFN